MWIYLQMIVPPIRGISCPEGSMLHIIKNTVEMNKYVHVTKQNENILNIAAILESVRFVIVRKLMRQNSALSFCQFSSDFKSYFLLRKMLTKKSTVTIESAIAKTPDPSNIGTPIAIQSLMMEAKKKRGKNFAMLKREYFSRLSR